MFCQITQKFDEVMALASSPRPADSRKVFLRTKKLKPSAKCLYDRGWVISNLDDDYFSNFTYSEALHIILAGFQSEPLSLKYSAMKKVLVEKLEVKGLPEGLQVNAEKVR